MALAGKLALVTGAGGGIGQSICRVLAREGSSVICAGVNRGKKEELLSTLNSEKKCESQSHSAYVIDVSSSEEVSSNVSKILDAYGRPPDILVNNAGIIKDAFLLKMDDESFDRVLDVNLRGTFLMTRNVCQAMKKSRVSGSVVNISSVVGKVGNVGQTNYAASKAGVIAFTKSAAKELAKFNIRVNCICPGFITTPMTDSLPDNVKTMVLFTIPLGRFGEPDDIAETVSFLVSNKAKYITGGAIDVNGGML